MTVTIRDATADDLPLLADLNDEIQRQHASAYPEDFVYPADKGKVEKFFAALMRNKDNRIVLAELDGAAAGYLWYEAQRRRASALKPRLARLLVHHVFVRPEFRRQGVAVVLMAEVQSAAQSGDFQEIALDTWASNERAQAFFAAYGFEVYRLALRKPAGGP